MQVPGTFPDEISHDIPHRNWGKKEWDADFGYMRRAGIEHVILIRCATGPTSSSSSPGPTTSARSSCRAPPTGTATWAPTTTPTTTGTASWPCR